MHRKSLKIKNREAELTCSQKQVEDKERLQTRREVHIAQLFARTKVLNSYVIELTESSVPDRQHTQTRNRIQTSSRSHESPHVRSSRSKLLSQIL